MNFFYIDKTYFYFMIFLNMGCWNYSIYFSIFKIALILYFWIFHKFFKGENIQIFPKGKKKNYG